MQAEQELNNRMLQSMSKKKSLSTPSPMATKEEQPARKPLGEIF
jgi:hypothetical protein